MEQLQVILTTLIAQFSALIPKLLSAIVLIVLGRILAKTISVVLKRILEAIKIDKMTEKLQEVDLFSKSGMEVKASAILSQLIYYIIFLIFATAASDALGLAIVSQQITAIINLIPKIITAGILFAGGTILANIIKKVLETAFRSLNIPSGKIMAGVVFYFLLITISITALEQTGLNTAFLTQNLQILLIGIIIAFAVGFGFSSRDLLKNMLASSYAKKIFGVGQIVKIGEYKGTIVSVDRNSVTILLDQSGHKVIVPQHEIINSKVEVFENKET